MIKFIQCVRRKHGLSKQEFREHWAAYHEKVTALADASEAKRCILSTALVVDQNLEIMQSRGTLAPYDGMVEVWWERGVDVVTFLESDDGAVLMEELRRAQEEFMDLPKSTFFFASEDN